MLMTEEEKRVNKWQRKQFSHVGLAAASFIFVTILAQILVAACVWALELVFGGEIDLSTGAGFVFMSAVPMYLIAFPIAAALLHLIPKCGAPQRQRWGLGKFAVCFVVAVGIGFAGNLIGQLAEWLKPWGTGSSQLDDILTNSGIGANVLVTVIMAPIVEELFFRKLIMDRLLGFGELPAILLSGLMFGLAHGNFTQFFYAAGLGILFGYIYAKTGKVSYTIACHMLFNFLGGVIVVELTRGTLGLLNDSLLPQWIQYVSGIDVSGIISLLCGFFIQCYSAFMLVCFAGGIAILILYRGEIHFLPGKWPIPWRKGFQTIVLNVGMLIYLCMCIGLFLVNW